jgi:peptidyl-prolyl cis-trans isomerase B (cyclophilin B)
MRAIGILVVPALVLLGPPVAAADEGLLVPAAEGLVLDGKVEEKAWESAIGIPVGAVEVPAFETDEPTSLQPVLRVLAADGQLWVAVSANEPQGPGIGLALRIAVDGAGVENREDAVALVFAPQSIRGLKWVVHGPRGSGRDVYRVRGAERIGELDHWSLEIAIPFADLGLPDEKASLRFAAAVRTRAPSVIAWSPAAAAFAGAETWALLRTANGWPVEPVEIDARALVEEDERDADRLQTWNTFVTAYDAALADLLAAVEITWDENLELTDDVLLDTLRRTLVAPLERITTLRPDLVIAHVVRGGVLHQLGLYEDAARAFEYAFAMSAGSREARFGLWLSPWPLGETGQATSYEETLANVDDAQVGTDDVYVSDSVALRRARVLYAQGTFEEAAALLGRLEKRYPFMQAIVFAASRARRAAETWQLEQRYREVEAEKDDLPRVRLETTKGSILLELFEDDASNTVKNFVWLVDSGFYDVTAFHRTVPFFLAHGGDPRSRAGREDGPPGPGWAIPTLRAPRRGAVGAPTQRRRRTWRGSIAMVSDAVDAAGSQFAILTGTAPDVEGDLMPFGRVLEGQDVAEALAAGDRIERATVVRKRPGTEYRPLTVEGSAAPIPR